MLSSFHINDNYVKRDVFYFNGNYKTWQKPRNSTFIQFFVLGSGGGGGGGNGGGTGTARRGGGGGASSAFSTGLFLATTLPDELYIYVASGGTAGIGSPTSSDGRDGGISYVMLSPDSAFSANNIIIASGAAAATGGDAGASGGTAGVAGTVWSSTSSILPDLGMIIGFAGQSGVAGLTPSPSVNIIMSGITTGGGAGAGTNGAAGQDGSSIIGFGNIPTMSGGTADGGHGSGGYKSYTPAHTNYSTQQLMFMGGAGGGSSNASRGGDGGDAAFGCGGGGGGAGFTNLGGDGGRGGDGLVIITTW